MKHLINPGIVLIQKSNPRKAYYNKSIKAVKRVSVLIVGRKNGEADCVSNRVFLNNCHVFARLLA